MGRTNPDIIREVEKGLERRMSSVMSQSFENAGGVDGGGRDAQCFRSGHRAISDGKPWRTKIPSWSKRSAV